MPSSRRRAAIGATALALGGLAPLATGAVGIHGFLTQGFFVSKTGDIVTGLAGWITCIFFVLAGFGMMGLAVWQYRKYSRTGA